ncbi:hypothetical protein E2C01_029079 [Portunus trituberculatus]|uniref:Uncharacterized protein n=1 Tax=Portunus trituberculatus TaxID=210409 RepID=A0A5B7EMF5_PORTR|nr:hypothetical protein [Portunus trituberculatus]
MEGKIYLAWAIIFLTVARTAKLTEAQEFIYTKFSCDNMIPQHTTEVTRLMEEEKLEMESNHVNTPTSPTTEEEEEEEGSGSTTPTTTTTTTTTTRPPPAPKAQVYNGNINMQILTSEDKYRRLKTLEGEFIVKSMDGRGSGRVSEQNREQPFPRIP